ncbi:uncharacterized protein LOC117645286 [Thrips palmi]|uniref:Uncharacterized protein LOC117645286 n=1 Tax=Thrips palmi TaxID=161013 RepID=A0A6P8YUP9_THRPL|nr:uncharacterized protein LOC117645286 [Thrips palmi]
MWPPIAGPATSSVIASVPPEAEAVVSTRPRTAVLDMFSTMLARLVPLLLLLGGPSLVPSPACVAAAPMAAPLAAPWDGIVGFLQTVAHLQERRPDPQSVEEEDEEEKPLRKIVYAVEEQVSDNQIKANGSVIVYDSQGGQEVHVPATSESSGNSALDRKKRSADGESKDVADASETGRQNGNVVTRPFLIGRKLWYVPLWFSLYLILYITALTVKSVARHRIKYPTLVSEDDPLRRRNGYAKTASLTRRVSNAISNGEQRYQRQWSM